MDIDVDQRRVEGQCQHIGGMALAVQHVGIGLAHRVHQQAVAHEAAVDVEILAIGAGPARGGQAEQSMQAVAFVAAPEHLVGIAKVGAEPGERPRLPVASRPLLGAAAVDDECEADPRVGDRDAAKRVDAMGRFGGRALEELAPRRRVRIEVGHFDDGADGAGGRR